MLKSVHSLDPMTRRNKSEQVTEPKILCCVFIFHVMNLDANFRQIRIVTETSSFVLLQCGKMVLT